MIALEQRRSEDIRTLGKLFFFMANELDDITFRHSMQMLLEAMLASIRDKFNVSDAQMDALMDDFVMRLPAYLQESLSKCDQQLNNSIFLATVLSFQKMNPLFHVESFNNIYLLIWRSY